MTDLESALRALITSIVRSEVRLAVAEATRVDEFLSTASAARVADVSTKTIRRWIESGKLTRHNAGRELRVSRIDLEHALRGSPAKDSALSPEELADRMYGDGKKSGRRRV